MAFLIVGGSVLLSFAARGQSSPDYPICAISPSAVKIDDGFWARKIEVNRTVSIQHVFDRGGAGGARAGAAHRGGGLHAGQTPRPRAGERRGRADRGGCFGIDSRNANPEAAIRTQRHLPRGRGRVLPGDR